MRNVLIITLYGESNYGNKFQNYAMQTILSKLGLNVYTNTNFNLYNNEKNNYKRDKKILYFLEKIKKITIIKIINRIKYEFQKPLEKKRQNIFEVFSNKYLNNKNYKTYKEINEEIDMICIGSDQIWNPHFAEKIYFTYGQFSNNVFSYAASFGINEIPDEYKEKITEGLCHIKYISIREEKGADIVEELIGKRPEVLVDPTLLLSDKEWDKIEKVPKKVPKNKYILTYFLGDYSKERKEYINNYANNNNMEVVNLAQIKDKKYYCVGPSEFLYFIKNSELFFTDSFHGCVFSILYKKSFYVMNREDNVQSMNSRMETLLKKFQLQDRVITNYNQKIDFNCNFSKIDKILEIERKKSMKFLNKAICMEENKNEN